MGVTIHFEGRLRGPDAYLTVVTTARRFAQGHGWECDQIEEKVTKLKRVRNEEDWDYEGSVKGVVLQPHQNSEPMRLEFDSDLYIQEYTKTQFAPLETHIAIVELLNQIEPCFEKLEVFDEGEYFETGDRDILKKHIDRCFKMLDEYLAQGDKYEGPVRLSSKRIADIIEK
jgi:hypothetical protein